MKLLKGLAVIVLMAAMFAFGWFAGLTGLGPTIDPASLPEREARFHEQMKNSSLVGYFTLAGRDDRPAAPDRYDFTGVDKVSDGRWRFNVRMRHSGVDVTLPVTVPVQWVGNTPMIDLTDYSIPRLGTFSARVIFDCDRYAGTWQSGQYGGHMYGRIEKQGSSSE